MPSVTLNFTVFLFLEPFKVITSKNLEQFCQKHKVAHHLRAWLQFNNDFYVNVKVD